MRSSFLLPIKIIVLFAFASQAAAAEEKEADAPPAPGRGLAGEASRWAVLRHSGNQVLEEIFNDEDSAIARFDEYDGGNLAAAVYTSSGDQLRFYSYAGAANVVREDFWAWRVENNFWQVVSLKLRGGCQDDLDGLTFVSYGVAASGGMVYKASGAHYYIYYDRDCADADRNPPRWIIDYSRPEASRIRDLDKDAKCKYEARLDVGSPDTRLPSAATWKMFCPEGFIEVNLSFEAGAVTTTTTTTALATTSSPASTTTTPRTTTTEVSSTTEAPSAGGTAIHVDLTGESLESDVAYSAEVSLGEPEQPLKVAFDTTVSHSWVPAASWDGHATFNPDASETLQRQSRRCSIAFGEGEWVKDSVRLGEKRLGAFDFIMLTYLDATTTRLADGLFGLGFNENGTVPMLEAMVEAGHIDQRVFSIFLARGQPGSLTFGEPDDGRVVEHQDLESIGLEGNGRWSVPLDAVWFGDDDICLEASSAIFAPHAPFVTGPESEVTRFRERWGATRLFRGSTWRVPCDADGPSIAFRLDGRDYTLEGKDLVLRWRDECVLAVMGAHNAEAWTLGAPFHQKFYSVFDAERQRVRLAEARHGG